MAGSPLVERSFYVPINRDANLSDGLPHETMVWEQFSQEMFVRFEGGTRAPVLYRGFYRDPDQGTRVDDESLRYIVALPEAKVDEIREFLPALSEKT